MSKILSSNLFQRIITGIIGISIISLGIYLGEWTYFFLLLLIMIFCLEEFYRLTKSSGIKPFSFVGIGIGIFIYSISFLIHIPFFPSELLYLSLIIILLTVFLLFIIQLYRKSSTPFLDLATTFLGIIYIVIPFSLFHYIAFFGETYRFERVMGIFFLLWSNDIGAYFSGKAFGKTKLFERISPKKTWEGTIGGALFTMSIAFVISIYYDNSYRLDWISTAMIISICGTYGDLIESMFKRGIQIKDSGSVLKGHGGFLDRFDSLLLTIPFIVCFLLIWRFLVTILFFSFP